MDSNESFYGKKKFSKRLVTDKTLTKEIQAVKNGSSQCHKINTAVVRPNSHGKRISDVAELAYKAE